MRRSFDAPNFEEGTSDWTYASSVRTPCTARATGGATERRALQTRTESAACPNHFVSGSIYFSICVEHARELGSPRSRALTQLRVGMSRFFLRCADLQEFSL